MASALAEALKAAAEGAARAALTAGAATGAAHAFPLVLKLAERLGRELGKGTVGKLLLETPRRRALELVNMIGQAFSSGVAKGAGLKTE